MNSPNSHNHVICVPIWFVENHFFFLKWEICCNFQTIFQHSIDFVSKKENKINSLCAYFVGFLYVFQNLALCPCFLYTVCWVHVCTHIHSSGPCRSPAGQQVATGKASILQLNFVAAIDHSQLCFNDNKIIISYQHNNYIWKLA